MWKVEFDCFTDSFFQWFILHNWQTRVLWIDRPAVVPLLMIDFSVLPLKLYRHLSVFPQREAARAHRSAKRVTMQLTGKVDNRGNACVVSSSFSLCLLLNEKKKKKKNQSILKLERWRAHVHEVFIDEQLDRTQGKAALWLPWECCHLGVS